MSVITVPSHTPVAGASSARHSLRPLMGGQGNFWQTSGASRREIANPCLIRHCEEPLRRSNPFLLSSFSAARCIASLHRAHVFAIRLVLMNQLFVVFYLHPHS